MLNQSAYLLIEDFLFYAMMVTYLFPPLLYLYPYTCSVNSKGEMLSPFKI